MPITPVLCLQPSSSAHTCHLGPDHGAFVPLDLLLFDDTRSITEFSLISLCLYFSCGQNQHSGARAAAPCLGWGLPSSTPLEPDHQQQQNEIFPSHMLALRMKDYILSFLLLPLGPPLPSKRDVGPRVSGAAFAQT